MSSSGETGQDDNSNGSSRRSSATRRPNVVEFVDSQDPNVRSAIQRHTAYHSAAQRRETRSRLLRRSSQTRYFEWGRRPPLSTETSTSSTTSSVSMSPAPSISDRPELASASSNALDSDDNPSISVTATDSISTPGPTIHSDDSILQFYTANFCVHCRSRDSLDTAVAYMREHEASRNLLLAYAYATRWKLLSSPETVQDQVDAQTHYGRGTNVLWNRLCDADHASSDSNIQAVLLLMAYTSDFGQSREVELHAEALRTMIEQRGGIDTFGHHPALQDQLRVIDQSREFHLTLGCETSCPSALRFPGGVRLSSSIQ
ncbi:hypothetical protein LTR99_002448 [Exophiala xenobiotica]|nr:hypothetical protein LTR96_002687 [Exophiala xenobiotica]KAK5306756.1 hypothetical protein LTR99_002448 [Exophiala xenobiotica]KAK5558890.1 hypothetical protein LTR46_003079 [Exophiala xenobiotica]